MKIKRKLPATRRGTKCRGEEKEKWTWRRQYGGCWKQKGTRPTVETGTGSGNI